MKSFCIGCSKSHDDFNWVHKDYKDENGNKSGWFCTKWVKPSKAREVVDSKTAQDRVKYAKDLVQPRRKGIASKEFMELYPKESAKTFTREEVKNSKYVWRKDLKGL